jgi:enoyl-CoA hydratase
MGPEVLTERDGPILEVVLNRPGALNALNRAVLEQLDEAMDQAESDASVRAVVIRGAGERAFCAGADLDELGGLPPVRGRLHLRHGQRVLRRLERSPVPSIAAVHGLALGGGLELALACSFILGADDTRFGLPEAKLGLMPGYGGTQRFVRAVGRGPALKVMLTGEDVDADAASRLGLLAEPPLSRDRLHRRARELARAIAGNGPLSVSFILEAVRATQPPDTDLDHEATLGGLAIGSEDAREGVAAFRARRAPRFTGR